MKAIYVIVIIALFILCLAFAAPLTAQSLESINGDITVLENQISTIVEDLETARYVKDAIDSGENVACGPSIWAIMSKDGCSKLIADRIANGSITPKNGARWAEDVGKFTRTLRDVLEKDIRENETKIQRKKDQITWLLDARVKLMEQKDRGTRVLGGKGESVDRPPSGAVWIRKATNVNTRGAIGADNDSITIKYGAITNKITWSGVPDRIEAGQLVTLTMNVSSTPGAPTEGSWSFGGNYVTNLKQSEKMNLCSYAAECPKVTTVSFNWNPDTNDEVVLTAKGASLKDDYATVAFVFRKQ